MTSVFPLPYLFLCGGLLLGLTLQRGHESDQKLGRAEAWNLSSQVSSSALGPQLRLKLEWIFKCTHPGYQESG